MNTDQIIATMKEKGVADSTVVNADAISEPMLKFFAFAHLPENLQVISAQFYDLACKIVALLPRNPERTVALRKLLEAKDCAVRARIE